ncbi:hypothetical protein HII31_09584 [Pseudocercospora fuligena]|uniref:Uncharacterized protein n=1 Tax=Pseudocercospora fuligena TaxID=685502 RepID=A0A8H6VG22_9PEZI|nr:hypothetical protein HII31_09584 [Pseudocercospora fuligena]
MRHTIATQLVLGTSLVAATYYAPDSGIGAGPPNTSFVEENQHPDASKSVEFHPIRPNDANGKPWTWTVNVTKIGVPDAESPPGLYPPAYTEPDAQIVNTVYSFSWAPDGNTTSLPVELDEQRDSSSEPICVSPIEMYSLLPPNVTNLYNDTADPSGNCAATIGQTCVDAIKDALLSEPRDRNGCRGRGLNLTAIPECTGNLPLDWYTFSCTYEIFDSLECIQALLTWITDPYPLNNPNNIDNGTSRFQNETYSSGEAFHYISTIPYNTTRIQYPFDEEQLRVHMLLVNAGDDSFNALCMRINTSVEATDDPQTGAESLSGGVILKANAWLGITVALAVLSVMI